MTPHDISFISLLAKHYLDYIGIIPVVIMEFVDGGCLRSYLNDFKRNVNSETLQKIKIDFLLYGKQIAEGMSYLVRLHCKQNSNPFNEDTPVIMVKGEQVSYSGKFLRTNIFGVFKNQIYSWKKLVYSLVPSQLN